GDPFPAPIYKARTPREVSSTNKPRSWPEYFTPMMKLDGSSLFSMGGSPQGKPMELRSTKTGLPLMSFANGRNFRLALRLIVSGMGSGESANRRLGWTCLRLAGPRKPPGETMSRSSSFKDSSVDESHLWLNRPVLCF